MIFELNYKKYLKYLEKGIDEVNKNFFDCYDIEINKLDELISKYREKLEKEGKINVDITKELVYMLTVGFLKEKALEEIGEKNKVILFQKLINNDKEIIKKVIPFIEMIGLYLKLKD